MGKIITLIALILTIGYVFLTIRWVLLKFLESSRRNKIKNILKKEDFDLSENDKENEIKKLRKNVSIYFRDIFLNEFRPQAFKNFLQKDIGKNKSETKVAWEFFVLITTSVIGNESGNEFKGLISEAVTSMYNTFKNSKSLLLELNKSSLITDVILKILNLKIRPILVFTRSLPLKENKEGTKIIDDDKLEAEQENAFWEKIESLRKDLIENKYLRFISLASLSNLTNNDIIKLLNYKVSSEYYVDNDLDNQISEAIDDLSNSDEQL